MVAILTGRVIDYETKRDLPFTYVLKHEKYPWETQTGSGVSPFEIRVSKEIFKPSIYTYICYMTFSSPNYYDKTIRIAFTQTEEDRYYDVGTIELYPIVEKQPTTLRLTTNKTRVKVGESFVLTAEISPPISERIYLIINGERDGFQISHPINDVARASWTLSFSTPGTYVFQAEFRGTYKYQPSKSNTVTVEVYVMVYPTRISISAPDTVIVEQSFTVRGKLEYQDEAGVWHPLAGRTVSIYYDGNKLADAITDGDGSYSATVHIPSAGTYMLKAVYAGNEVTSASSTQKSITSTMIAPPPPIPLVPALFPIATPLILGLTILATSELMLKS